MINSGKQFENDFSSSIPSYCFIHRLKDTAQSYNESKHTKFTWDNPCDFFVFDSNSHLFYAIECKSTKYKSISFQIDKNDKSSKMIKYHQIESLINMSKYNGIIAGLLLNFRDEDKKEQRTYFINIENFCEMKRKINKRKKEKIMEKVVLKDGTGLEIQNGATENTLTMQLTEENTLEKLVATMTEENLAEYKILTESGVECTTLKDKYVKSYTVNTEENTVRFHLTDVDTVVKRLAELEATQEMQDEAITELAEMAAESEVE